MQRYQAIRDRIQIISMILILYVMSSCGSIKFHYILPEGSPLFISDTSALLRIHGMVLVYNVQQDHYINNLVMNYLYFKLKNNSTDTIYLRKGSSVRLVKNINFIDQLQVEKSIDSAFAEKVLLPMQQVKFHYNEWAPGFKGNLDQFKKKVHDEAMIVTIIYSSSAEKEVIHTDSLYLSHKVNIGSR